MRLLRLLLSALLAVFIVAPAFAQRTNSSPNHNVLTPAEATAGWRLLFDGDSLLGWRSFRKATVVADRWTVEDHCLHLYARSPERQVGGDLMTQELFGNFEFAFEWKAAPGVNSGVKYLVDEYLAPNRSPVSFEYQIQVEKDSAQPIRQPLHSTGALYDMLAPNGGVLRPDGAFNESRIVVRGALVEHWLNGEKLLEFNRQAPEFRELVAKSKFARWAGFGMNGRGHITLQDHGGEIYFRRLRVRDLPGNEDSQTLSAASRD
ncbi:MAG: DUF1080 domain-containing protein [Bryobacterales bacterium]|nr:DUF1080 domain-containing protein [Bryobacterales bacterium]